MCDYSLTSVKSRDAKLEDRLTVHDFGTGTRGFRDTSATDCATALCVKPGTEIAFDEPIRYTSMLYASVYAQKADHSVAIFRQVNKDVALAHHDALEFPDGTIVMLTCLYEGQTGKILQLPAEPKTAEEAKEQERVAWAG